jgi:wyosine [tRNA(Phe)-imidazoG37] synthetase (radical SAM superfamily)
VAGPCSPTLHPDFEEISERISRVRDRLAPGLRLAILSNSTTAAWPDVRRGLALYDERHMKLDAGDAMTYALVNGLGVGCTHQSVGSIVEALSDLPRIIVQAMFVRDAGGEIDNTTDGSVREWLAALERVQPARAELYTLARPPALSRLRPAPVRRLREIAGRVRAAGIPADVFR